MAGLRSSLSGWTSLRVVSRFAAVVSLCQATGCGSGFQAEYSGPIMGTRYTIKVAAPAEITERTRGFKERLDAVNSAMSTYLQDSEVSRFNRHRGTDWFTVSADTARVVQTALRIGKLSGGALDITVAPVVNLWGFGPAPRRSEPPGDEEIARALEATGLDKIEVREDPPAIRKSHPAAQIDLSAIAKGFAVDEVARYLEAAGAQSYMVEVGGEVRTRGKNVGGEPWRIGLVSPVAGRFGVDRTIGLSGRSMATSGDYRNFFEHEGRRYSHTIDPRTGRPVTHRLASVSVVASSCMEADALATALLVLGPEAGYQLALEEKLAALFIVRAADKQLVERITPAMQALLRAE